MFSTTSEYALRALVQLAREPAGASVLGQDLASRAHIPANYLADQLILGQDKRALSSYYEHFSKLI